MFLIFFFFFFNDTATTEIYTLSLHDALPILFKSADGGARFTRLSPLTPRPFYFSKIVVDPKDEDLAKVEGSRRDRKSTRLNSSHVRISYAVFCLKKKKKQTLHDEVCDCRH